MPYLVTQAELAEYLGLSVRTLEAWRLQRRGPSYIKVGGAVRYPAELVNEFVADLIRNARGATAAHSPISATSPLSNTYDASSRTNSSSS